MGASGSNRARIPASSTCWLAEKVTPSIPSVAVTCASMPPWPNAAARRVGWSMPSTEATLPAGTTTTVPPAPDGDSASTVNPTTSDPSVATSSAPGVSAVGATLATPVESSVPLVLSPSVLAATTPRMGMTTAARHAHDPGRPRPAPPDPPHHDTRPAAWPAGAATGAYRPRRRISARTSSGTR